MIFIAIVTNECFNLHNKKKHTITHWPAISSFDYIDRQSNLLKWMPRTMYYFAET